MRSTGGVGGDPGFVAIAESAFLITRQPTLLVGLSVSEQVEAPVSPKDDDDASLAVAPEASQLNRESDCVVQCWSGGGFEWRL